MKRKLAKNSHGRHSAGRRDKERRRPRQISSTNKHLTPAMLRRDWRSLTSLERGERLKQLVMTGISRRRLAKEISCSESLVRRLIQLADSPAADRKAIRSGELGVKAALRRARRRRIAAQRVELSPEERAQKIKEGSQLVAWFTDQHVPSGYQEQFIAEIKAAWHPLHPRHLEWSAAAPKQRVVPQPKEPEKIIKRCRPRGDKPSHGIDLLNYCFAWFARWSQRVFPDPELLQEVIALAR